MGYKTIYDKINYYIMKIIKQKQIYNKEFFYYKRIICNEEEFYKLQDYFFKLGFAWIIPGKQEYKDNRLGLVLNSFGCEEHSIYYFSSKNGNEIEYKDLFL